MPTLEWIGKEKVINHHMDVSYRVLSRVYSYDLNGRYIEDNRTKINYVLSSIIARMEIS